MGRIVKHPLSRLLGANSIIALHRDVIRAVGSYEAAALCEQVVYWMPKAEDPDGWVYKTADEWREELCFTRRGFDGARASLIALGILQHDYKRVKRGSTYTRVLSFRVDLEALYNALGADAQPVQADMYEAGKPSGGETYKPGLHETYKRKEQRLPTETTDREVLSPSTLIPFADPPEWRESASAEQLTRLELARYNGLKSDPSAHPHVRAIRAAGADVWREFVKLGVLGKASDVTLASWAQAMSADLEKHGREKVLAAIHAVQATPPEKRAYVWNWYRDELDGTKPARKVAQDQPSDRSRYDVKPLDESEHDSIRQRILKLAGEEAA
jgi:hypothetical protein